MVRRKSINNPKIKMRNDEHREQVAVFKWIDLHLNKYPALKLAFAIPNGSKRNIVTAVNLKREGCRRGVPDIILLHPSGGFHGLAVEMKKEKGGVVSPEQKEWIKNLNDEGYSAHVCKGAESAIETIKNYLELP